MLVSYNWLKEYIDIDISPLKLSEIINLYGLPIEEIIEKKQKFSNVFVSKILDIKKHPNADNLSICKVTDNNEVFEIVCGAKNIKIGDVVPLAKEGAILPDNIKIKKTKIRGFESSGMLCSAKELGLSDDHTGILILDPNKYKVGEPFIAFEPDTIFNFEITPNRPDLLCITGIARFLSAILDKKINMPLYDISRNFIDKSLDINSKLKVEVHSHDLCPRYAARIIEGVKVMESPSWLKEKLKSSNIRPINNIVDITNFILLELNQPLHAFDYDKIQGKKIIVRNAGKNEKILALDGKTYTLEDNNLIIADSNQPIAIAGIMGGEHFSINNSTHTIVLESAFFNPKSIRKTSRILNISSDSSYRFERQIDIENCHNALNRATELIISIAGGKTSKNYIDIYSQKIKRKYINLRYDRVNKLLGLNLKIKEINNIFAKLKYKIIKNNNKKATVQIPGYRVDIKQEVDLIEDIAQIYGYENIPLTLPVSVTSIGKESKMRSFIKSINELVNSYGFYEAINYSFLNYKLLNLIQEPNFTQENSIFLKNPFNNEEQQLKTTLIPDLLKNLITNYNKENENIHLFETGKIYIKRNNEYIENINLALISSGNIIIKDYNNNYFKSDFYFIKTIINNLIKELTNINEILFAPSKSNLNFYEYSSNIIIEDNIIGKIGQVREEILYTNKIKEPAFIAEINLDILLNYYPKKITYRKLSVHPVIKRDLSIIVPVNTQEFIIEKIIRDSSRNLIKDLVLCDLYKGEQIPDGYKSLTYSIILQSDDKTLTDNEINKLINDILFKLQKEVKAELRS
jgi:phenylalanyl-tRNA synthetase beta chain